MKVRNCISPRPETRAPHCTGPPEKGTDNTPSFVPDNRGTTLPTKLGRNLLPRIICKTGQGRNHLPGITELANLDHVRVFRLLQDLCDGKEFPIGVVVVMCVISGPYHDQFAANPAGPCRADAVNIFWTVRVKWPARNVEHVERTIDADV